MNLHCERTLFLICIILLTAEMHAQTWTFNPPVLNPLPPDFAYKVELGRAKTSYDKTLENIENIEKLLENARNGEVPYSGMTPEWVIENNEPVLEKEKAKLIRILRMNLMQA